MRDPGAARSKPIVVVGSLNVDLVTRCARIPAPSETLAGLSFEMHPGGKGANQAVAAARLLRGADEGAREVHLIGRLGADPFADRLRVALVAAGVRDAAVSASPGASGAAVILVAETGENSIVVAPGANALLTPADLDTQEDLIRSAAVVLTQLEIPLATVLHLARICKDAGVPLILDPAPPARLPAELLRSVAWWTPNETEAAFYLAEMGAEPGSPVATAQALLSTGPDGVILKLGARGCYLATRDGQSRLITPHPVKALDTTAAGDAFNGAFAVGLARALPPIEAAAYANAAAALSTTCAGAQPSLPDAALVERLMREAARD